MHLFPLHDRRDPIMSAYNYAKRESIKEGFVPVLIKADDEILWECLIMNSDPDSDGEDDYALIRTRLPHTERSCSPPPLGTARRFWRN